MYLNTICKISTNTYSRYHMQLGNLQVQNQTSEPSQNQRRWMTSMILSSTYPSTLIKNTYSCSLLHHNIILLGGLLLLLHLGFSKSLLLSPSKLSLLSFQAAHLHQYLVEDLQQTLSEKNAQFVLHSDELNSR